MTKQHVPVLAGEVIRLTDPQVGESVIDATFGGGGHARLFADRVAPSGKLTAIDRDPAAHQRFREFADEVPVEARFVAGEFSGALRRIAEAGEKVDLVLLDLGVSSMQIDTLERGFSYVYDAPLDMRMDTKQAQTARELVNEFDERRLAKLFGEYGEERYARQIAKQIVKRRETSPIETTAELVDTITSAIPVPARFAAGHPAKRVFQALRIAVNHEIETLEAALPHAWRVLRPGGRLAVISFHSLEDRIVKRFLADLARGCVCPTEFPICVCGHEAEAELISRRAIGPSAGEIADNPRAKSGKLRIATKLREGQGA